MTEFLTEQWFADFIFYTAPFVFVGAGFALGWILKEYFMNKKEKKIE